MVNGSPVTMSCRASTDAPSCASVNRTTRTSVAAPDDDAMHTNTYPVVANVGSTARPSMPASLAATTSAGAVTSWACPPTMRSRRPGRSVTSIVPFGRKPMSQG